MVMAPSFDKFGMKKGAWSEDEDNKLRAYIQRFGHHNWRELPKLAGLSRCGKSCRLRWKNYLCPNVKRGNYSKEEEDVIISLQKKFGNKWSKIAEKLPGRSDNEIKNHWHAHLKSRAQERTMSKVQGSLKTKKSNPKVNPTMKSNLKPQEEVGKLPTISSSQLPLTSAATSSCNSLNYATSSHAPQSCGYKLEGDFWTDPFLLDNYNSSYSSETLASPLSFIEDVISEASFQEKIMNDAFLWSVFDLYF